MAKYNTGGTVRAKTNSVIETTNVQTKTYNGDTAWVRTPKSELFLLGVSSFNEDSFYETAKDRNERVRGLVSAVLAEPDGQAWLFDYIKWLRAKGNIRTQSMIIALEAAKAMIDKGISGGRKIVDVALQRADEPAEAIAYWHTTFGRKIPAPVKRGIADAAVRLYNEHSVFKYDSKGKAIRFADVIQLVHPAPKDARQSDVFKFSLDRRYNDDIVVPDTLKVVAARQEVKGLSGDELRKLANSGELAAHIAKSGMTWEALSGQISGGMDAKAWEAVIPNMGYMALLRNLRNFIDAKIDRKVMTKVLAKISDPDEVAKSKQLPFRFLSAFKEVSHNLPVAAAVETALQHSLVNVPELKGRTLILVDNSGSMSWGMSSKSKMKYGEAAGVFGSALALANDADLYAFGDSARRISFKAGESILSVAKRFNFNMGATYTQDAINKTFNGHDRVIILTDEQSNTSGGGYSMGYGWGRSNPRGDGSFGLKVPVYVWNLAGYIPASGQAGNVFTSGGLSDSSFKMIEMIEAGRDGQWPWIKA